MKLTVDQLAVAAGAGTPTARAWIEAMQVAMNRFEIDTPLRVACFLSQCSHESFGLTKVRENLNYTPEALIATFGTRITKIDANRYGRTADHRADQQAIANIVYAGRMGNGPMESGNGWRYRAGGPLGLTFLRNYQQCGDAIDVDLVGNPILIERPDIGAMAAAWFWFVNGLNKLADKHDVIGISGAINAGNAKIQPSRINGLDDRIARTAVAMRAFNIQP